LDKRRTGIGTAVVLRIGDLRGDSQISIDRWLLIAVDVLLSVWIIVRIIMLPAMVSNPGDGRLLTTYMQYRAEQRGKRSKECWTRPRIGDSWKNPNC
jgi:hypothetical protein